MALSHRTMSLLRRGVENYFLKRPFCVSFEVTYSCNAHCKHCHLGGPVDEERANPQRFGDLCKEIKPVVAQISGGEPLLRKDLEDIIRAIRIENNAPYIVVTTNGTLLTKEKYQSLREAGVDEFSLSLDFPDERHDDFRGVPGLFKKIESLLKGIEDVKDKGITLSGVVQSKNYKDLIRMAEFARKWNVKMNFSTYTWLRTNDKSYMIPKEELPDLKDILNQLLKFKKKYGTVFTSEYVLKNMIEFFEKESIPRCGAGKRFFVVNPDGTLSPCGLIIRKYHSQKEIIEDFTKNNSCTFCYTSIRANSEKPVKYLIKDNKNSI